MTCIQNETNLHVTHIYLFTTYMTYICIFTYMKHTHMSCRCWSVWLSQACYSFCIYYITCIQKRKNSHVTCIYLFTYMTYIWICTYMTYIHRSCRCWLVLSCRCWLVFRGLFCRILSLLKGSFAKETYNFKEPTKCSHPIGDVCQHTSYDIHPKKKHICIWLEYTYLHIYTFSHMWHVCTCRFRCCSVLLL